MDSSMIAVILFLFSTLLVFTPSVILMKNSHEIQMSYFQFLPFSLTLLFICTFINIGLIVLIPKKWRATTILIEFSFGILLWVQSNILNWNYGVFDGKPIIWDDFLIQGLIDIAIWLIIPFFIWKKRTLISQWITRVSMGLVIVQVISLIFMFYSEDLYLFKVQNTKLNNDLAFSNDQNVIVLVLDTFRSDIFQEIIQEDPYYSKLLSGFTYYKNASSGYPTTKPSIPLILTGEFYDNKTQMPDFINYNFKHHSILSELNKVGYRTQRNVHLNETKDHYITLSRLTQFKSLPQFVKKQQFKFKTDEKQNEKPTDLIFYENIMREFTVKDGPKNFKYFHLNGAHPPFKLNESLDVINAPFDKSGYKNQSKASMKIALELIHQLQNNSIYDRSLIFIIGDHGMQSNALGVDVKSVQDKVNFDILYKQQIVSPATPLFLFKRVDAKGPLRISDAPVSLQDIPKTILTELNLKSDAFKGKSIPDIKEDEDRIRYFFNYSWDDSWEKEYMPAMKKFEINGHSWDGNSYYEVGEEYTSTGVKTYEVFPSYKLGEEIIFQEGANSGKYIKYGFSTPEQSFTWTDGKYAVLGLNINEGDKDLLMDIDAFGYLSQPKTESQRVEIYVNNQRIKQLSLPIDQNELKQIVIPKNIQKLGRIVIAFSLLDAASPAELGTGGDVRKLGIAVSKIKITAK